jgi:hypothetical protein
LPARQQPGSAFRLRNGYHPAAFKIRCEDHVGFRFQKRISILPGVRINLSKSGASASVGPRGADVNIGKDGITANAGIPGTGLSYRQKVGRGGKAAWLVVLLVMGGLAVWAFQHRGKIAKVITLLRPPISSTVRSTKSSTGRPTAPSPAGPLPVEVSGNMQRFVHRQGAILRDTPSTSGHILIKESKGAAVTLVTEGAAGWSKVTDGNVTGYMRTSVLGTEPPQ